MVKRPTHDFCFDTLQSSQLASIDSSGTPLMYSTLLHLCFSRTYSQMKPGVLMRDKKAFRQSQHLIRTSPRLPVKVPSMYSSVLASCEVCEMSATVS